MATKAEILSLLPGYGLALDEMAVTAADAAAITASQAGCSRRETLVAGLRAYLQVESDDAR